MNIEKYDEFNSKKLILIIEDELEIAEIIEAYLKQDGFRTSHAFDGQKGLKEFQRDKPDLVILDIRLPGQNGLDILQALRAISDTPVIMLTALTDDLNKLLGLRLGADDYITKPFNPSEVIARIHAVLRRTVIKSPEIENIVQIGDLFIDHNAYTASWLNQEGAKEVLPFTLTEFKIIAFLAHHPQRCFSRFELIEACMPESDALDRVIDSHLSKLRRKMQQSGCKEYVKTVRGVGYSLCLKH